LACQRKSIVMSKGEEVTRAIAWAIIPLAAAVCWAYLWGTLPKCAGWTQWKLFFAGAYSAAFFDRNSEAIFHAAKGVFWWNVAVLWRVYALVFIFWFTVDFIIWKFGKLRHWMTNRKLTYRFIPKGLEDFPSWIEKGLTRFIMPRVSEWHVFLTNMLVEHRDIRVHADVLTKNDVLYTGFVKDHTLATDGSLRSIILADPRRFRREEYLWAKKRGFDDAQSDKPKADIFWADIPSNTFVVMGSEIVSINVNHSSSSALVADRNISEELTSAIRAFLNANPKP
jgi:hypothetical protein